jgi:cytochrome c peroxidase
MKNALVPFALLLGACSSKSSASTSAEGAGAEPTPAAATAPAAAGKGEAQARREEVNPRLLRRFKPLRADFVEPSATSKEQQDLGRMLFFDTRLSRDHDLSCNSCHSLDAYGVDGQPTSSGAKGQKGNRNSPSVYHAAGNFTNFWDGRAATVEEQAKGPILNPGEMAMPSPEAVVERLVAVPGYVQAFAKAFPDDPKPLTYDNVGRAIGAFERKLVTPSRWDEYLNGKEDALTAQEVAGLKIFTDVGCMTCHTGELVGGSMFQKVGVIQPWPNQQDRGRAHVTKTEADEMMFKVPPLRNVAKTAPYFHDGSAKTLQEAVRLMGRHQLGEELADADVEAVVAWLGSLTGELPGEYIKKPELPQ